MIFYSNNHCFTYNVSTFFFIFMKITSLRIFFIFLVLLSTMNSTSITLAADDANVWFTLTKSEIHRIKVGHTFGWVKSPDVLIVEYSDPECPYCQRQYNNNIIAQLVANNSPAKTFWYIHKPVLGVNHQNTIQKSYALICAGKIGWYDAFSELEWFLFLDTTVSLDTAINLAQIDKTKIGQCVSSRWTKLQFRKNNVEFERISNKAWAWMGTPTTLMINMQTGKSKLVLGAFPLSYFQDTLSSIIE